MKNSQKNEDSTGLDPHNILLVGPLSAFCLAQLSDALSSSHDADSTSSDSGSSSSSSSSCWSVDWSAGVLCGDVLLDNRSARVEVSTLAGREPYEAMHDVTYASCDAVLCLMKGGFKKDLADRVFDHVELVKDGKPFWMCLVLFDVDASSAAFLKAEEWADSHASSSAVALEDEKALPDVLCRVATQVHRGKRPLPVHRAVRRGSSAPTSCLGIRWKQQSAGSSRRRDRPLSTECSIM